MIYIYTIIYNYNIYNSCEICTYFIIFPYYHITQIHQYLTKNSHGLPNSTCSAKE